MVKPVRHEIRRDRVLPGFLFVVAALLPYQDYSRFALISRGNGGLISRALLAARVEPSRFDSLYASFAALPGFEPGTS